MRLAPVKPRALSASSSRYGLQRQAVIIPRGSSVRLSGVSQPVVGFVTVNEATDEELAVSELLDSAVVTLKDRVMQTEAFRTFQQSIENKVNRVKTFMLPRSLSSSKGSKQIISFWLPRC